MRSCTETLLLCGLLLVGIFSAVQVIGVTAQSTNSVYSQSHVTTTNDQTVYESSFQNFGFYAQGRYWLLYEDSAFTCEGEGGCLFYTSSADGSSWTNPRNVGIHVTDSDWSIITSNDSVYYARYNESSFDSYCNKALLFGYGTIQANGTIAWQLEQVVLAPDPTVARPNEIVRVDSNGQVWIGYQEDSHNSCGGTGLQRPHVIHSAGNNYSQWIGDTILSTAHSNNWDIDIAVLSSGRVYALYWVNTLDLHGRIFNGTSWGPDEQVSSLSDSTDVNSFVFASGSIVYAIWYDGNSGMLRFGTRSSSSQWIVNNIGPGETGSASSLPRYSLPITATFDPSNSKFYIFWYNATRQVIDQWSGSGNVWSLTPDVFSTAAASGEYTMTSYYQASIVQNAVTFGVMWVDQPASPYNLNFGLIETPNSAAPTGAFFDYIVTIILENQGLNDTYGSQCRGNCTYITGLANSYSLALDYSSIGHPSLPNYLALTSGGNYDSLPFNQDCYPQVTGCLINAPNLVDSMDSAGVSWKAYMEDYSGGGCSLSHTSSDYINSHNPFVYYTDIYNNATRCNNIVDANPGTSGYLSLPTRLLSDLGSASTASNYMWLSPNLCDDGHDSCAPLNNGVSQQNQYLSILIPQILTSYIFTTQRAALFVVWDESSTRANNIVTAIWSGPVARTDYESTAPYIAYSAVRTVEDNWNLPTLTSYDSAATSMKEFLTTSSSVGGHIILTTVFAEFLPILVTASILLLFWGSAFQRKTARRRTSLYPTTRGTIRLER